MTRHFKALLSLTPTESDDILGGDQSNDILDGLGGNDILQGRGGDDILIGGSGNDQLIGWEGADTLTGGSGADTFSLASQYDTFRQHGWASSPDQDGQRDTITDFNSAEGDKIDLSGLVKYIDTDGDQKSEVYAVSWDDVSVETLGADSYRVHVHQVLGDPTFDIGIDVIGVQPLESDFVFSGLG